MNTERCFCEVCRKRESYDEIVVQMVATLRGKEYTYVGREAHCTECGSIMYVPSINDSNLEALYDVYRQENHIISLKDVREIPGKYAIGKRPLSQLLGWGELTLSRYINGDVPTRQYSDILTRIYNDPKYYSELLETNRGNIAEQAYAKSRKAVDALIHDPALSFGNIDRIIQYLLNQCEYITHLELQKALYYVQGFGYAFCGNYIFDDDCQAWVHGPVYANVYSRYKDYHFNPIDAVETFDLSLLSPEERAVCDGVIKHICCYSAKTLEEFTHRETPWLTTREGLDTAEYSTRTIEKSLIGEYFGAMKERYHMETPEDIGKYSADIFARICCRN